MPQEHRGTESLRQYRVQAAGAKGALSVASGPRFQGKQITGIDFEHLPGSDSQCNSIPAFVGFQHRVAAAPEHRLQILLNYPVNEVHDDILNDSVVGVDAELGGAVLLKRAVGDLDDAGDIRWTGMALWYVSVVPLAITPSGSGSLSGRIVTGCWMRNNRRQR